LKEKQIFTSCVLTQWPLFVGMSISAIDWLEKKNLRNRDSTEEEYPAALVQKSILLKLQLEE